MRCLMKQSSACVANCNSSGNSWRHKATRNILSVFLMACDTDKAPQKSTSCTTYKCVCIPPFSFNRSGVLWFQSVESLISGFLGGILFYTHYLRWSLLLARFRIIILKAIGVAHGLHHRPQNGPAKRICARSLWGRGCGQSGNCFWK